MRKWSFIPNGDTDDITVYIGAHVPPRLYRLMVEEATRAGLSHSKMIGQILAERYSQGQIAVPSKPFPEEEEPHGSTDGEITVQTE